MPTNLKTDEKLLQQLKESAGKPMSADELREQRVSFILGSLSKKAHMTRAKVEQVLKQIDGAETKPPKK